MLYSIKSFFKRIAFNFINKRINLYKNYDNKISKIIDISNFSESEYDLVRTIVFHFFALASNEKDIEFCSKECISKYVEISTKQSNQFINDLATFEFYNKLYNEFWIEIHLMRLQMRIVSK